jgi:hypothetical protein
MSVPRPRRPACALAALLVVVQAVGSSAARGADGGASDEERARTLATDLFDRGNSLMEQGRCDVAPVGDASTCVAACDAFRRAFELYPQGLGALRNLAYVEKALGRTASAARDFRELARRAPLDPRPARRIWAEFARTELAALEPLVPHLLVQLPDPTPAGSSVSLDGAPMPRETWGVAMAIDPGEHAVHVEADGCVSFDERLTIATAESRSVVVRLAPRAATSTPDVHPVSQARTWALGTTIAGAAIVVVGLGFGAAAIAKRNAACDERYCDPAGYDQGRAWARTSTILTGVGLAVGVGGVAWYLLAPKTSEPSRAALVAPYATPDGAGLVLVRRF